MPVLDMKDVVDSVMTLMRARSGRLVAVSILVPTPHLPHVVADLLREELRTATNAFIEVSARSGSGPLRLVSAEFSR